MVAVGGFGEDACQTLLRKFDIPRNNSFLFHNPFRKGGSLRLYDGAGNGSCVVCQLLPHSTGNRGTISGLFFGLRGRRCGARLLCWETGRIPGVITRNVYMCLRENRESWTYLYIYIYRERLSVNSLFSSIISLYMCSIAKTWSNHSMCFDVWSVFTR